MSNTSLVGQVPDDEFTSRAETAAQLASDAQTAAETAEAGAEQALADTLAALDAQIIADHADATITAAVAGQMLQWNGSNWINAFTRLADLADVDLTGLADGDAIAWVQGSGSFEIAQFLRLSGGILTGPLTLFGTPVAPQDAATKAYVDANSQGTVYDIGFFYDGQPGASDDLGRYVTPRPFFIPGEAGETQAHARIAPAAPYTATLQRNGVAIGTIAWAAGNNTGVTTITSGSNENFVTGDRLSIVGAGAPDAALDDVTITIGALLGSGS